MEVICVSIEDFFVVIDDVGVYVDEGVIGDEVFVGECEVSVWDDVFYIYGYGRVVVKGFFNYSFKVGKSVSSRVRVRVCGMYIFMDFSDEMFLDVLILEVVVE